MQFTAIDAQQVVTGKRQLDQIKLLQRTRINSDFGTIANLTETQMPGPQVAMPVIQRMAGDYFETMLAEHRRHQLASLIGLLGVQQFDTLSGTDRRC